MSDCANEPKSYLHRTLGLAALTAFGVGDILGADVYGLVGKVAGLVGHAVWPSYVLASVMAALTGLAYAEWVSRHPRAGGAWRSRRWTRGRAGPGENVIPAPGIKGL
jgi:amino acid transporter